MDQLTRNLNTLAVVREIAKLVKDGLDSNVEAAIATEIVRMYTKEHQS